MSTPVFKERLLRAVEEPKTVLERRTLHYSSSTSQKTGCWNTRSCCLRCKQHGKIRPTGVSVFRRRAAQGRGHLASVVPRRGTNTARDGTYTRCLGCNRLPLDGSVGRRTTYKERGSWWWRFLPHEQTRVSDHRCFRRDLLSTSPRSRISRHRSRRFSKESILRRRVPRASQEWNSVGQPPRELGCDSRRRAHH